MVVGDAVEQRLQVVGAALEHRLAGGQPLVVGHQPVAPGAVLLRRGGRRPERDAGLPDPDVGLLVQKAARLLEVAVGLARAAGPAELVHQLGREAAERRHDAALVVRHVVEDAGRGEERQHRRPAMDVDLAGHQVGGGRHGAAFAGGHVARLELRVVVDILDDHRPHRIVEDQQHQQDAPAPAPDPAAAGGGGRPGAADPPGSHGRPWPAPARRPRWRRRRGGRIRIEGHSAP